MNSEDIFAQFDAIDDEYRMLCIDAAAVGCWLYAQGHHAAGMKLLHTVMTSAGLDTGLVQEMLNNPQKCFAALAMHAEIRELVRRFSG